MNVSLIFADLANILQDDYGAPEVANMKHGQLKIDVTIVTNAVGKRLTTRVTLGVFLTRSLQNGVRVEREVELISDSGISHLLLTAHPQHTLAQSLS